MTEWLQKTFTLSRYRRGFHLVTGEMEQQVPELGDFKVGIAQVFIHHTSASLTLNENADPTVRTDFESHFNAMIPEDMPYYRHTSEGSDDMPAHLKAALLGSSLMIPVSNGRFLMGTWQGIYLCEHRDHASGRTITVTVSGQK